MEKELFFYTQVVCSKRLWSVSNIHMPVLIVFNGLRVINFGNSVRNKEIFAQKLLV